MHATTISSSSCSWTTKHTTKKERQKNTELHYAPAIPFVYMLPFMFFSFVRAARFRLHNLRLPRTTVIQLLSAALGCAAQQMGFKWRAGKAGCHNTTHWQKNRRGKTPVCARSNTIVLGCIRKAAQMTAAVCQHHHHQASSIQNHRYRTPQDTPACVCVSLLFLHFGVWCERQDSHLSSRTVKEEEKWRRRKCNRFYTHVVGIKVGMLMEDYIICSIDYDFCVMFL